MSIKLNLDGPFIPLPDDYEEIVMPEGGWTPVTCSFESHKWQLEVEEGRARIICVDPCPSEPYTFDPCGPTPTCLCDWMPEDFSTPEALPVRLRFVDDSSPSTPMGPAEYGFWIDVLPIEEKE